MLDDLSRAAKTAKNSNGRPVGELPILNYSSEIGPERDAKRREAVLKYYGNDVVKATEFLDIDTEYRLIQMQMDWLKDDNCKK